MANQLILFAASRDQLNYFEDVARHVHLPGKEISVIKYSKIPGALLSMIKLLSPLPTHVKTALQQQVDILRNRKQASQKGQNKPFWFWKLFTAIESIRAKYLYIRYSQWLADKPDTLLGIWNGKKFRQAILVIAAQEQRTPMIYFETGPLPGYSVVDPEGVDFYAAIPREIDFYKNYPCHLSQTDRIHFTPLPKTKDLPDHYIFIPFQVVEDSNIYLHSPWIKDMRALYAEIEALAEQFPQQHFVIKPHPACPEDYSDLMHKNHPQIHFLLNHPTTELVQHADAVITVNSTVGMEALIAHKKVIVLGQAIYGFEGLTQPVTNRAQLVSALKSLNEWSLDEAAIDHFLCYLQQDYAIPGDAMRAPSTEHWKVLAKKLTLCLEGRPYQAIGL
ncbi:capsular polysaccharide export protein, LipB/KpsS family [Galenea microaerophila]